MIPWPLGSGDGPPRVGRRLGHAGDASQADSISAILRVPWPSWYDAGAGCLWPDRHRDHAALVAEDGISGAGGAGQAPFELECTPKVNMGAMHVTGA